MAMPKGARLQPNERWSLRWPGFIEKPDGRLRTRKYGASHYCREQNCSMCGARTLHWLYSKIKESFCSMECRSKFIKQKSKGNKTKRKTPRGHYILVRNYDHPRADRHGTVREHFIVAEQMLGRPIKPIECVHHIDLVKSNNDASNLFVCSDHREHFLIHGSLNDCVSALLKNGALIFDAEAKRYRAVS